MLNIDLPIHAPQLDAEGQKMFEVRQAKKSKLVQDFLSQNTKTTYTFLTLKPKDLTRRAIWMSFMRSMKSMSHLFDATLKSDSDKLQKLFAQGVSGLSFERLH